MMAQRWDDRKPGAETAFSMLVVDDDPIAATVLCAMLSKLGQVRVALSGADALRLAASTSPDLILLDIEMPGMNGFVVCAALKSNPQLRSIPIIFVTSHTHEAEEVLSLSLGAEDFIVKPPQPAQLNARVQSRLRAKREADGLRFAARTDATTGLANRRHFDEALEREWSRAQRAGSPLSLLMFDVDHFKAYNDRYGHPAGDRCLEEIASALRATIRRPADLVARYGGEEFVALLPDTDTLGARSVAAKVLDAIEELALAHQASSVANHVTLSIGVSGHDRATPRPGRPEAAAPIDDGFVSRGTSSDLVAAADQALYAAKEGGRRHACFLSLADVGAPHRMVDLRSPERRAFSQARRQCR